mmetsp:Transcript_12005/g.17899  ORF Transcript_12005/g.17899 Transcript_12005/m.17899 type:complete len:93 (+) Transcript_12005:675-953(+)
MTFGELKSKFIPIHDCVLFIMIDSLDHVAFLCSPEATFNAKFPESTNAVFPDSNTTVLEVLRKKRKIIVMRRLSSNPDVEKNMIASGNHVAI